MKSQPEVIVIFKIFIKVMESGITLSMIISLLFAFLRTKDIRKKRIFSVAAISLGVVAAIVSAIVREIPNFVNRASLSFWSMLPIVIAAVGLLILIPLKKKVSDQKAVKYENCFIGLLGIYVIGSFFYYMPPILIQLNNFVYYGESAVSTMVLFRIIGYVLGIVMMILSAVAVYNTTRKLSRKELENTVFISLLIAFVPQFFVIVQRLYSLHLIIRNGMILNTIAFVLNNERYFHFGMMLFLLIIPILLIGKNRVITEEYRNKAELRKIKYTMKKNRQWAYFFLVIIVINVFSLSYLKNYVGREVPLSAPEEYTLEDGMITIPLSLLEDNHLHRFTYKSSDGVEMRFFAIKKSPGSYVAVLDACEICGSSGYFERKDDVVCKLCDVVMNRGTIGFKGGCNPIPFPYRVHDEKIKIDPRDLDKDSYIFK